MKENIKIVNKLEENTGPFKLLDEGKPFLCDGKIYIKLVEEIPFYDIAIYHPFIWNNKLYFKISEDVGFNPETREQATLTSTCGVQDCNLKIKIIK